MYTRKQSTQAQNCKSIHFEIWWSAISGSLISERDNTEASCSVYVSYSPCPLQNRLSSAWAQNIKWRGWEVMGSMHGPIEDGIKMEDGESKSWEHYRRTCTNYFQLLFSLYNIKNEWEWQRNIKKQVVVGTEEQQTATFAYCTPSCNRKQDTRTLTEAQHVRHEWWTIANLS